MQIYNFASVRRKLTPVEVVLPDQADAVLREVPPRLGVRRERGVRAAQAPPPDAGVHQRALPVRPLDDALASPVTTAVPLAHGIGAVAVDLLGQADVVPPHVVPLAPAPVVEAVVVVELRRVAVPLGVRDAPVGGAEERDLVGVAVGPPDAPGLVELEEREVDTVDLAELKVGRLGPLAVVVPVVDRVVAHDGPGAGGRRPTLAADVLPRQRGRVDVVASLDLVNGQHLVWRVRSHLALPLLLDPRELGGCRRRRLGRLARRDPLAVDPATPPVLPAAPPELLGHLLRHPGDVRVGPPRRGGRVALGAPPDAPPGPAAVDRLGPVARPAGVVEEQAVAALVLPPGLPVRAVDVVHAVPARAVPGEGRVVRARAPRRRGRLDLAHRRAPGRAAVLVVRVVRIVRGQVGVERAVLLAGGLGTPPAPPARRPRGVVSRVSRVVSPDRRRTPRPSGPARRLEPPVEARGALEAQLQQDQGGGRDAPPPPSPRPGPRLRQGRSLVRARRRGAHHIHPLMILQPIVPVLWAIGLRL